MPNPGALRGRHHLACAVDIDAPELSQRIRLGLRHDVYAGRKMNDRFNSIEQRRDGARIERVADHDSVDLAGHPGARLIASDRRYHLMSRTDKDRTQSPADEAGCASDQDPHGATRLS